MKVDPKALVRRLTPTATRSLEAAVGRAATSQAYEIVPEHLLLALVEPDAGDAALLLAEYGKNRAALRSRVERSIADLRAGNAARPVFSQALFTWLREAWLVASVERGALLLRTGDLLATYAEHAERYSASSFPELDLPYADLRTRLAEITARSPEASEQPRVAGDADSGIPRAAAAGTANEALSRFTISFTQLARAGKLDPVLGRHVEIRQIIDVLSRRRKNNPILVGEPGVGKTALVEGLARAIVAGEVPESLANAELVGLDLGALQAGSGVRGEFEQRLKSVIGEIKASLTPILLFIDEAHTLIGAGGAQGTGDAANLLKPELARGELRTIAATTWSEYKRYFEKDAALERRFQPVKIEEPSEAETVVILRGLKEAYEKAHGVVIRDAALVAAARLSHRYISGRQLPDKAVDLLDSAAARTKTEARAKPEGVVALEDELFGLARTRSSLERDIADGTVLDTTLLDETRARIRVVEEQLRVLSSKWEAERNTLEALRGAQRELAEATNDEQRSPRKAAVERAASAFGSAQGADALLHADADAHAVARMVQSWTGIPVGKLETDSLQTMLSLETHLAARIKGQDAAVRTVSEAVRMSAAGIANPDAPRAVLLFVGTSGVGKTETALALSDLVFGGERFLTSIAMSEFQEKHSVSRLIGSPPGYVGYGQGGVLTEAVRRHPYSVVLLDECEKADIEVMNLFYQVFDKGTLNDGEGRRIDFRNTIVILTSNLATDVIARLHADERVPSPDELAEAIRPSLSRHFKPALLARMSIVPFAPMSETILREIVVLKLAKLRGRMHDAHRADVTFAPELVDELARRCTESETGARNIDHVLRASLMPELSREVLSRMAEERPIRAVHVRLTREGFGFDFS